VLIDYHFQHACDVIKAELGIVRIGGVDTSDKPEWSAGQRRCECWPMRNARSRTEMRNRNGYHMFLLASRLSFESMHPSLDWKVSRISLSNENHSFSHIYTKSHPPPTNYAVFTSSTSSRTTLSATSIADIATHTYTDPPNSSCRYNEQHFQRRQPTVLLQQVLRT
jgi:hypothetical protein